MSVIGETVTRIRPGTTTNGYGDTILDWSDNAITSTTIYGCSLAPRQEGELAGAGRAGVIVGYTLYAPPGTDLKFTDRILHDTLGLFEIDGEPGRWDNPYTGNAWGVTAALKRVEG